jgi:hypothetical protein
MTRAEAEVLAEKMTDLLEPYCEFVEICGSYRRGREDPGDLDIVIIPKEGETLPEIVEKIAGYYEKYNWIGEKKTQLLVDGVKVDIKVSSLTGLGAALLYFTGPAGYNIGMRRSAKSKGMKLNEYGIWNRDTNEYLGGATEEEIYDVRDVLYIGRGTSYAIALEGALKLKEISYIHAEAYAAGELKHGPIALIDDGVPVIVIAIIVVPVVVVRVVVTVILAIVEADRAERGKLVIEVQRFHVPDIAFHDLADAGIAGSAAHFPAPADNAQGRGLVVEIIAGQVRDFAAGVNAGALKIGKVVEIGLGGTAFQRLGESGRGEEQNEE